MTEPNWLARSGATPRKLATVGVLTLVLIAVVWHNAPESAEPVAEQAPQAPPLEAKIEAAPAPKPTLTILARKWPEISLDKAVRNDPFAMPSWYLMAQAEEGTAGASLARSAQVLEELKKQQTKIIVISNEDRIATIGDQSFRVGDMIEGFQVTEITTDGIVLTEINR
jgi:hypothetical protein